MLKVRNIETRKMTNLGNSTKKEKDVQRKRSRKLHKGHVECLNIKMHVHNKVGLYKARQRTMTQRTTLSAKELLGI